MVAFQQHRCARAESGLALLAMCWIWGSFDSSFAGIHLTDETVQTHQQPQPLDWWSLMWAIHSLSAGLHVGGQSANCCCQLRKSESSVTQMPYITYNRGSCWWKTWPLWEILTENLPMRRLNIEVKKIIQKSDHHWLFRWLNFFSYRIPQLSTILEQFRIILMTFFFSSRLSLVCLPVREQSFYHAVISWR